MIGSVISEGGAPVEIAPGRGNLRNGSVPFVLNLPRSVTLINRTISFANLVATQPMLATMVGWYLRQSRRVPLKVYRRIDDENTKRLSPSEHPVAAAVAEPWEGGAPVSLTASLLGSFLVQGNAITELLSGAKEAVKFLPLDWRYALPVMAWRDSISGWEVDRDHPSTHRTVGADTVLHIADWSPLGPLGISPLEQLGVTLAIEDAAQRHQRATLANGVRAPLAIQTTDDRFFGLDPQERKTLMENLRADIDSTQAGPENSGRPWLLPPGLAAEKIGQTAVEADLINQRIVNRTEALGVYGLPPAAASVIERGAELPEQRQIAYTDGLAPPLILIEEMINAQLVRGLLKADDVFVEFDLAGILRGDKLKEIETLREAIASALMTPEQAIRVLNLPTTDLPDAMKTWYLPRNNLIPIDVPYAPKGMVAGGEAPSTEQA